MTFVNPYEATGQAGFTAFGWFLDLGGAGGFVSSCVKSSWEGGRSQTLPDQWMWFWCMLGLEHLWCCTYQDQMNMHLALPLQRDEQDGKKATFQSKEERVLKHVISWVPIKLCLFDSGVPIWCIFWWFVSYKNQLLERCKVHTMFLMQHDLTVWSMPLDETSTRWNKVGGDFGVPRVFFYEWHPSKEAGFAKWYDRAEMALECGVLDCDWESTLSSST